MGEALVIATGNPHKVAELRAVFDERGIAVVGLKELGLKVVEPAETGLTFEMNAQIKARSYAEQTGRVCLADDSGLEIDALGGRPGVISSHYSTEGVETGLSREERDAANNARVMRELEGVPREKRAARFVCVMCVCGPGGIGGHSLDARGVFEGRIGMPGEVPRGVHGFGYDPLFVTADGRTSAELSAEEKNLRSHRGMAAREMAGLLERLRGGG